MFLCRATHAPLPFGVSQSQQSFSEGPSLCGIKIDEISIEFFLGEPTDDIVAE